MSETAARKVSGLECRVGGETVRGRLHLPADALSPNGVPGVLIVPGFADTAGGPHNMHAQLADSLARAGYAVARFDYRGLGESDGDFGEFTLGEGLADANAVLDTLVRTEGIDPARIGIVGYSLGGAYAAELAASRSEVRAAALLAPVAYPARVFPTFFRPPHWEQLERDGRMDWLGWTVGRPFIESLNDLDPLAAMDRAGRSRGAVLALHGSNDREVPIENAYAYASRGAGLYVLQDADHPFSSVRYKETLFEKVREWFQDHLII